MVRAWYEHSTSSSGQLSGADCLEALKPLSETVVKISVAKKMQRDHATNQLKHFSDSVKNEVTPVVTTSTGAPIGDKTASLTVGPRGPILLQDFALIDELAHFDRERIPERAVHAKGAGAFGYFEVTHDITKYCKAALFSEIGKKTPIAVRFSTVGGEEGSADTVRDVRGFAVKFYTEEGNWDIVGNNTPIFFLRDPILFPSFIHTRKRNPVTHLKDPDMFWDLISLRPETTHQLSFLFSDRGTPDGYRYMNGHGSHTFKLVNAKGEAVYCKFHFKSDQGIKNLDAATAHKLTADDPDYATRDLYNAIAAKNNPSWTFKIQVMTFDQAEKFRWNPFDMTKVWPQGEFPLIPVGRIVLDRNPKDYFAEIEQIAFSPSHMVPGVEPSPDKMLQARLFSYPDTQRHRLGANFMQIPVNCPYRARTLNYQRDGPMTIKADYAGYPNYFPNSFGGPKNLESALESKFALSGDVARYQESDGDEFSQVGTFWSKVLDEPARQRLVYNLSSHLKKAQTFIQERVVENLTKAHPEYGRRVREALNLQNASKL